jgi:hypothetical protein
MLLLLMPPLPLPSLLQLHLLGDVDEVVQQDDVDVVVAAHDAVAVVDAVQGTEVL